MGVEMDAEAAIKIMNEKVDADETMKIEDLNIDTVSMIEKMNTEYHSSELLRVETKMNKSVVRDISAEKKMNSLDGLETKFKPSAPKVAHIIEPLVKTAKVAEQAADDFYFIETEAKMSAAVRSELALMNKAVSSKTELATMNILSNDEHSHLDVTAPSSHEEMNKIVKIDNYDKEMNALSYEPVKSDQMI